MPSIAPIEVTFLGPSGVGKTSVLAAMSEIIKAQAETAKVKLTFEAESQPRLDEAIVELHERCYRPNVQMKQTLTKEEYELGVAPTVLAGWVEGATVPLRITDYPGEWLTDSVSEHIKDVKATINKAAVVLIAIDTVGLMLARDPELAFVNNHTNTAEQVTNVLRETLASTIGDEPKLVMLVPLRCEKWMHKEDDQKALVARVRQIYADAIQLLSQPDIKERVALVIAPINTLGIIEFLKIGPRRSTPELMIDPQGNEIIPDGFYTPRNFEVYYHRVTESKVPKLQYADHLLRYALAFSMVLSKHRSNTQIRQEIEQIKEKLLEEFINDDDPEWWKWIVRNVGGWAAEGPAKAAVRVAQTILNWPANAALGNFANGRRETLPFQIVQGRHLLTPME
jgi:hypothetical protein